MNTITNFITGDHVKVFPAGQPEQAAIGRLEIASLNADDGRGALAVSFGDKPAFLPATAGLLLHPVFGCMLLLGRNEGEPYWRALIYEREFEVEPARREETCKSEVRDESQ